MKASNVSLVGRKLGFDLTRLQVLISIDAFSLLCFFKLYLPIDKAALNSDDLRVSCHEEEQM